MQLKGLNMLSYFLPFTRYPYKGTPVKCPVCSSDRHAKISGWDRKLKRLETHICDECGLFFHHPMPTDDELAAYYASVYRLEYQFLRRRPSASHQRRKTEEAERRVDRIATVADLSQPRRILDVGCGSGEVVRAFAARGHEAHGIEPGTDFADHAASDLPENAKIHGGGLQGELFPDAHFDVIVCMHVIEHLNRPLEAVSLMRQWLAPGGVMMLEVPDMYGYKTKGFDRFHFAHTLGFTRENFLLLLQKCGLAPLNAPNSTSVLAVASDDPRATHPPVDLAAKTAMMRKAYQTGSPFSAHLKRHLGRLGRILRHEIGSKS
ncbi:MAG: class I SAM-dependent methyltransferase [Pseudomonadota bacterium]